MILGVAYKSTTLPLIDDGKGGMRATYIGGTIDDAVKYIKHVKEAYGRKMAMRIVSEVAADARKVWFDEYANADVTPAYSWKDNRQGKLRYGSDRGPAWSHDVHKDSAGVLRAKDNKRMASFSMFANTNSQATSTLRSFPMNLWEHDVTYRSGNWGPWGISKGRTRVRPGIHWIENAIPGVEKVIPGAMEKAVTKVQEEVEKETK